MSLNFNVLKSGANKWVTLVIADLQLKYHTIEENEEAPSVNQPNYKMSWWIIKLLQNTTFYVTKISVKLKRNDLTLCDVFITELYSAVNLLQNLEDFSIEKLQITLINPEIIIYEQLENNSVKNSIKPVQVTPQDYKDNEKNWLTLLPKVSQIIFIYVKKKPLDNNN